MEIKVRKIVALILCICLCVTAISAEAKTKKTTGKDGKYITWNYDKDTKTLTFSGKGPISDFEMDGHGSEPEWYVWNEQNRAYSGRGGDNFSWRMVFSRFLESKISFIARIITRDRRECVL